MKNVEIIISKFLSDEISLEEEQELKSWVNANRNNKKIFYEYVNIWQTAHPAFDPEKIQVGNAYKKVMLQIQTPLYRRIMRGWNNVAAILLLPLIISFFILLYQQKTQNTSIAYQEIYVPYGNRSKIDLPDGSIAFLNSGSSLKFPTVFDDEKRVVSLVGEGYFDVHSDAKHPFIVQTNDVEVKATGTIFNVEAYANQSVAVTMLEGKVEVSCKLENARLILKPNEHMVYNRELHKFHVIKNSPYKWCAWKDGKLILRDDSLSLLYAKLGNMFNVDFIIEDKELTTYIYHGCFSGESLSTILELLELTAPLTHKEMKVDQNGKRRIVVHKLKK